MDMQEFLKDYGPLIASALTLIAAWWLDHVRVRLDESSKRIREEIEATTKKIHDANSLISSTASSITVGQERFRSSGDQFVEKLLGSAVQLTSSNAALEQNVKALRDTIEAMPPIPSGLSPYSKLQGAKQSPAEDDAGSDNWERLRENWRLMRERIEALISCIENGPQRAKYQRRSRYNYEEIIRLLATDYFITEKARGLLNEANSNFLKYRPKPWTTSNEAVEQSEQSWRLLQKELPMQDE